MNTLGRGDLAVYRQRRIVRIQWDDEIEFCIQSLTEGELAAIYRPVQDGASPHAAAIAKCLVDENGLRIFDDSREAIAYIEGLDSAVTRRLSKAIDEHLEYRDGIADKPIEELAKN